jgi:hypothetical protein
MPTPESLPYLAAIRRLESIAVETYFDPSAEEWAHLAFARDLRWTAIAHVPTAEALRAFAVHPSGSVRSLLIDRDIALESAERARLEASGLPVEWIHADN